MQEHYGKRSKAKLFITQFLMPHPAELLTYFVVSLLALLIASNQTLLVILSGDSPVSDIAVTDVFGQQLNYLVQIFDIPILGRIVLFIFWLAIGSIVYMFVWLFQNIAVEVYDNISYAKLKDPQQRIEDEDGWWGTTLSHTIFVGSSIILLLFYVILVTSLFFPAWGQLFQIGLQSFNQLNGMFKLLVAVIGTMVTFYIFVLFWKLLFRLRSYVFNSF